MCVFFVSVCWCVERMLMLVGPCNQTGDDNPGGAHCVGQHSQRKGNRELQTETEEEGHELLPQSTFKFSICAPQIQ